MCSSLLSKHDKKMHNPSPKPGRKKKKRRIVSVFSYQSEEAPAATLFALVSRAEYKAGTTTTTRKASEARRRVRERRQRKKRRREKRLEEMRICIPGGRKLRGHKSVQVGVKYEA